MLEKLRDPGKLPLAAGTVEDIIEATHQEVLRRAAFFQSAIFNSINFSSITTDAKGVIQRFNVGAERMRIESGSNRFWSICFLMRSNITRWGEASSWNASSTRKGTFA